MLERYLPSHLTGCLVACVLGSIFMFGLSGCDTASVRVPGLSFSFPETVPAYHASHAVPETIVIEKAVDRRKEHLGEDVAGTGWKACDTDTLDAGQAMQLVDTRLKQAVENAGLFNSVKSSDAEAPWVLIPEVQVFCSQTRGFIGRRAAGLASVSFTLKHNGNAVWQQDIAHVVTDADPEYTGSFVTTVEQAMRRVMADSMRLVFRDALEKMDQAGAGSAVAAPAGHS